MARGAPHFRGSPYDTAMYSTDGKELPALPSPPAPHTATDDLVQTCSSLDVWWLKKCAIRFPETGSTWRGVPRHGKF